MPENICMKKINKMAEFYVTFDQNARMLHDICAKIFFRNWGGHVPSAYLVSYAYIAVYHVANQGQRRLSQPGNKQTMTSGNSDNHGDPNGVTSHAIKRRPPGTDFD